MPMPKQFRLWQAWALLAAAALLFASFRYEPLLGEYATRLTVVYVFVRRQRLMVQIGACVILLLGVVGPSLLPQHWAARENSFVPSLGNILHTFVVGAVASVFLIAYSPTFGSMPPFRGFEELFVAASAVTAVAATGFTAWEAWTRREPPLPPPEGDPLA